MHIKLRGTSRLFPRGGFCTSGCSAFLVFRKRRRNFLLADDEKKRKKRRQDRLAWSSRSDTWSALRTQEVLKTHQHLKTGFINAETKKSTDRQTDVDEKYNRFLFLFFVEEKNFVTQDSEDFCRESKKPCDIQMIQASDLMNKALG